MVTHPDLSRMTVHVPKETFLASVLHFDWTTSPHCQEGGVYLQTDVFACTKGTANSTEDQTNFFFWHAQTFGHLFSVFVQPLRGNKDFNSCPVVIGNCKCRFRTKKGLVLHSYVVCTFNDDGCRGGRVTMNYALPADDVAIWVNWFV